MDDADLRAGAELASHVAIGLVEIPYFVHPFLQRVGREHPVLIFDDLPDFVRQARLRSSAARSIAP